MLCLLEGPIVYRDDPPTTPSFFLNLLRVSQFFSFWINFHYFRCCQFSFWASPHFWSCLGYRYIENVEHDIHRFFLETVVLLEIRVSFFFLNFLSDLSTFYAQILVLWPGKPNSRSFFSIVSISQDVLLFWYMRYMILTNFIMFICYFVRISRYLLLWY